MPITPTYPGIYIQEAPSSVHTITAAPTNIAVFIGYTDPLKTDPANWNKAVEIFGFADYQRGFGGFVRSAAYANGGAAQIGGALADPTKSFGDMAAAVNQFFLNGGTQAYIVGLQPPPELSTGAQLPVPEAGLTFTATAITDEAFVMTLAIRPIPSATPSSLPPAAEMADVTVTYGPAPGPQPGVQAPAGTITETYRRVTLAPTLAGVADPNFIATRINGVSALVTVQWQAGGSFAALSAQFPPTFQSASSFPTDPEVFDAAQFADAMAQGSDLDKVPVFNLMVIPGVTNTLVLSTALAFCETKRAFLIMDPPISDSVDGSIPPYTGTILADMNAGEIPAGPNAALYFPYLLSPDPLTGAAVNAVTGLVNEIPPSATVCGIFAATDLSRGVWKAPAGFQASANNVTGVVARGNMTDPQQGLLNPLGVNCLRQFPNIGTVVFGARTLVTQTDEQWGYVPVRRMALFLEQTFYANLKWVLFEPNAEPLWTAITMSITAFMLGLFKQGAFQGVTPSQAFFVQCDSQTTTQTDIDQGVVNIVVGFAPLKPAEFVVITIAQIAGQTQTS